MTIIYKNVDGIEIPLTDAEMVEFNARVPLPPAIPNITTRQFLIAAANASFITADEALAAATGGAIPANILGIFDALPSDKKLAAKITWAKMTKVERGDDLVMAAATVLGLTSTQMDNFFIQAASI